MAAQEVPTLFTFPLSHYCEKARWALQRYGIEFREQGFAPGFHRGTLKAEGGRGSVPLLRLPGGGCVDESTPILKWVDEQARGAGGQAPPLFPADAAAGAQVEQLVADFDKTLGAMVRVWVYSHLLYTRPIADAFVAPPVPGWQATFLRWGGIHLLRAVIRTVRRGAWCAAGGEACDGPGMSKEVARLMRRQAASRMPFQRPRCGLAPHPRRRP